MATSTITIISGASTVTLDNTVSTITLGTSGPQGTPGEGVPVGGTAGQILAKDSATDYDTSWIDNFTTDVRQTIKNDSGSTLAKGTAVYVSGANGTNVLVKAALANADSTSATTIGLLYQQLANNGSGYVVTEGLLTGIDTSAATAGDPVWLSGTVPGGLLFGWANEPKAPTHIVYLGTVARAHASLGEILVTIRNGWELDELHNVLITSPTDGQVLTYQSSTGLWVNSSETGDISAVNVTSPITGGGTSGAVTIGIDQTALSVTASQISDGASTFARLGAANAFTVGGHTITNTVAATVPLQITAAASQSGNLTEWRNSGAALLLSVTSAGDLYGRTASNARFRYYDSTTATGTYLDTALNSNAFTFVQRAAAAVGVIVKGAASQTANLQEWQNSAGTVLARVLSGGGFYATFVNTTNSQSSMLEENSGGAMRLKVQTAAAANPGAGFGKLYFRDGTTAGTLKLVVRAGAAGAETTILDNIPQ